MQAKNLEGFEILAQSRAPDARKSGETRERFKALPNVGHPIRRAKGRPRSWDF